MIRKYYVLRITFYIFPRINKTPKLGALLRKRKKEEEEERIS
jgi:hypothetical protein